MDGRFPAELQAAQACPPDAHAPRGHDDEAEIAVSDLDHVNSLRQSRPQGSLGDRVAALFPADVFRPNGELFDVKVLIVINERPGFVGHGIRK